MTPSEIEGGAKKYVATPYAFVPVAEGLAVYVAYGSRREYLCLQESPDDLWSFLQESFDKNALRPVPRPKPQADLDLLGDILKGLT